MVYISCDKRARDVCILYAAPLLTRHKIFTLYLPRGTMIIGFIHICTHKVAFYKLYQEYCKKSI